MTEPNQRSYLLRLSRDHVGAPWRATLIDARQPEERHHFATLEALHSFLRAQAYPARPADHRLEEWDGGKPEP